MGLYPGSDAIAEAWPRYTGDQRGAGVDGRRVATAVACPPAAHDHDVAVDEHALACSVNEDRRDLATRIDLACTHDELSAPGLWSGRSDLDRLARCSEQADRIEREFAAADEPLA